MSRQSGVTLVEVSIALVMMGIAALGIGSLINQIAVQERSSRRQIDLDTTHAELVHSLSRLENIRELFDLETPAGRGLQTCLQARGSQCLGFEAAPVSIVTLAADRGSRKAQTLGRCVFPDSTCEVQQSATYSWSCPAANECQTLNLKIDSQLRDPGALARARSTTLQIPARSLVSRGKIAFDCTANSLLFAIDYGRLTARCENLRGSLASLYTMPLRTFAGATPGEVTNTPETVTCPSGVRSLNLFASRSDCAPTTSTQEPEIPPTTNETCTETAIQLLSDMMIQRLNDDATTIATNCIDSVNPTLEQNLPNQPFKTARFMNTCGNRQCKKRGFDSGRVIELAPSGSAVLECRYSSPPTTFVNGCNRLLQSSSGLMKNVPVTTDAVASDCIDSEVPSLEQNRNYTSSPAAYSRFMQTCGKRACQKRQFSDGRVVETYQNDTLLECYNSPGELFAAKTATVQEIAQNCIDSANPELAQNMPGENNADRFATTCGDRYCRSVLNFRSGRVTEFSHGQAQLTCVR